MTTILYSTFSQLANATIPFDPSIDKFVIDKPEISAASVSITFSADHTNVNLTIGSTTFKFPSEFNAINFDKNNLIFADGSLLDVYGNSGVYGKRGSAHDDYLIGEYSGSPIIGRAGNDILESGYEGGNRLYGGDGDDIYYVHSAFDLIIETTNLPSVAVGNRSGIAAKIFDGDKVEFGGRMAAFIRESTDKTGYDYFYTDIDGGETTLELGKYNGTPKFSENGRYMVYSQTLPTTFGKPYSNTNPRLVDLFLLDNTTHIVTNITENLRRADKEHVAHEFEVGEVANNGKLTLNWNRYNYNSFNHPYQNEVINTYVMDSASANNTLQQIAGDGVRSWVPTKITTALSGDGNIVAFGSGLDINGNTNPLTVKNLQTGVTRVIATPPRDMNDVLLTNFKLSTNGRFLAFVSDDRSLVPDDYNNHWDIFVADVQLGGIERVNTSNLGFEMRGEGLDFQPDFLIDISDDGRFVLFNTESSGLAYDGSEPRTPLKKSAYIKDRKTGDIQRLNENAQGIAMGSIAADFTSDGQYILINMAANPDAEEVGGSGRAGGLGRVRNPFFTNDHDTVRSSVSYTLSEGLEVLELMSSTNINATGNMDDNVLTGNAGSNILRGEAGNDTLDGGAGADKMQGGSGDDIYIVDNAKDAVAENAKEGFDTVRSSVTYTLGANVENLILTEIGDLSGDMSADVDGDIAVVKNSSMLSEGEKDGGDDSEIGNGGEERNLDLADATFVKAAAIVKLNGTGNILDNLLVGNSGNNVLTGNAGKDILDGEAGVDKLIGGTGNDTYLMGRGYGADTIQENDATIGNTDVLQFLSGISADQIWMRKVSSNLEVSIIGTTDKITLTNWYTGDKYHVEQFKTSDGHVLSDSKVNNLVNAMAAFSPPVAGQTTLPPNYEASLHQVIAANWQ